MFVKDDNENQHGADGNAGAGPGPVSGGGNVI